MNLLDIVILALILTNIGLGYAFGLVRRAVAFLGLFAGIGAATLTSAHTSTYVGSTFGWQSSLWSHVVTYGTIVTLTVVLFEVLGAVYERWISAVIAPMFDKVTGMLAGVVLGAMQVALILILGVGVVNAPLPKGYTYPPAFITAQELFTTSFLAPHFYGLEPMTRAIFSMVLPGSVSSYFTQLLTP
jgi:uncharacterized membrane protein required for colicin V production